MTEARYSRLLGRIVGMSLAFALIPLLALAGFIYVQFSETYATRVAENLRTTVENKRMAIDLFLEEKRSTLRTVARIHTFETLISPGYLQTVFREMAAVPNASFVDLGIIDASGRQVAYEGPYNLLGANYSDAEWFHEVLLRGVHVSQVFMGLRRFPHFVIAIRRDEGEHRWILRATVDMDVFNALVQNVQRGEYGDAFLVNDKQELQTASRFSGGPLTLAPIPVIERFQGIRTKDWSLRGRPCIAGMVWLKNAPWLLVITDDVAEEMSPLLTTKTDVLLLTALGIIFIILGTIATAHTLVSRIRAADREAARLDASLLHQSKMAALGKMAAGVAHELNNPLTLIREAAGWLHDLFSPPAPPPDPKEIREILLRIDGYIERARGITHRMLGFGRRMDPVKEHVNINALVEETVAFLENEAMHRSIRIEKEYASDLPPVSIDPSQVQQVILNLVDNAIDAVGHNGTIRLRTHMAAPEGSGGTGGFAQVDVEDSGPGIPPQIIDKIFDPFFTTKAAGEGTGLGLGISYGIVEKLGGTIRVSSDPATGTIFSVRLPLA